MAKERIPTVQRRELVSRLAMLTVKNDEKAVKIILYTLGVVGFTDEIIASLHNEAKEAATSEVEF